MKIPKVFFTTFGIFINLYFLIIINGFNICEHGGESQGLSDSHVAM